METLAASLRVIQTALPDILVPAEASDQLEALADRLAPIHCAGFEVRLGDELSPVDLIQRIQVVTGEPARLAHHIGATPALASNDLWARLGGFLNVWSQPASRLHTAVAGAFLEFDAQTALHEVPIPSIYLSLEPGGARELPNLLGLIDEATNLLQGEGLSDAVAAAVGSCHEALPAGAAITDVGLMLSRRIDAIRLVVAPLPREHIGRYLETLNWAAPPPDIEDAVSLVPEPIAYLGVSLDVGAALLPRAGLEYYPGPYDDDIPAWTAALDNLVDADLCTPEKRDALLEWPGYVEPTAAEVSWPDSLLVDSLLNRTDQFSVLAKRLTFLKLVCQAGKATQAKVYFGFGPRSFVSSADVGADGAGAVAATDPAGSAAPADGRGAAILLAAGADQTDAGQTSARQPDIAALRLACGDAIEAAIVYLIRERDGHGMWREFPRILEGTDEWVSAYIGTVLASTTSDSGRQAALDVWRTLEDRRNPALGWGYNGDLPPDADSTLWGLRLAIALGVDDSPRAGAARVTLDRHLPASGGVATYEPAAEEELRRLLGDADLTGMFAAHTCVSAAVAGLDEYRGRVLPFLVGAQEANGRWRGYWWSDDEYTTCLAAHALAGQPEGSAALDSAVAWAAQRIDRSGAVWSRSLGGASAFATTLCAEILLIGEASGGYGDARADDDRAAAALGWLLQAQRPDGSWPASALMRMPPTDTADGDQRPAATTVSVDDRSLFTTATVIRTLTTAISGRRSRYRSAAASSNP